MNNDTAQRRHYDRITERYVAHYDDPWSRQYRSRFINQPMFEGIDLAGKEVLEAMCGSGFVTGDLLSEGAIVTGLDISEEAIRSFSRRWPDCRAVCASLLDSHLDDESFDCVVVVGGLHHLQPQVTSGIDEVHRILKVGGYFCFMEPHSGSIPDIVRRRWYRHDSLFLENEAAIDLDSLKQRYASRFAFPKEQYAGSFAYLLVLNSLVLRIPARLKRFYSRPLLAAEALIGGLQGKRFSCVVICQWRKQ